MSQHYYMLDTNIIISYVTNENIHITNFINDPHNHFYYTNTVKKEYTKQLLKNQQIPDIFKYIDANIEQQKITNIIDRIEQRMNLTATQKSKFMNDLTIILEAGFVCYDILPEGVYTEPLLLTNNLKLFKRFIDIPQNNKDLEDIIGAFGLEHLIKVVRPHDVVSGIM